MTDEKRNAIINDNLVSDFSQFTKNLGRMKRKRLITTAFALGFMVSREGFNGECDYEHCSPTKLEPHGLDDSIEEYIKYIITNPAFDTLRKEVGEYMENMKGEL